MKIITFLYYIDNNTSYIFNKWYSINIQNIFRIFSKCEFDIIFLNNTSDKNTELIISKLISKFDNISNINYKNLSSTQVRIDAIKKINSLYCTFIDVRWDFKNLQKLKKHLNTIDPIDLFISTESIEPDKKDLFMHVSYKMYNREFTLNEYFIKQLQNNESLLELKFSLFKLFFRYKWIGLVFNTNFIKTIVSTIPEYLYKMNDEFINVLFYYINNTKNIELVTNIFAFTSVKENNSDYKENDNADTINTLNLFINNNNLSDYELFIFKNIIHSLEYPNDLYSKLFNTTNVDIMYKLKEYTYETFINDIYNNYNKDNKLLSIVIPVYDNEEYLERCLDSVFIHNKFIKELIDKEICEVIILNDYDNRIEEFNNICYSYCEKHDVKITYKTNTRFRNIFSTRCKLFRLAKGEYISTVDTDDIYNNDVFEVILYQLLGYKYHLNHTLDVIECCYNYKIDEINLLHNSNLYPYNVYDTNELPLISTSSLSSELSYRDIQIKHIIQYHLFWSKIVRTDKIHEILNNIPFLEDSFIGSSDDIVMCQLLILNFENYLINNLYIITHFSDTNSTCFVSEKYRIKQTKIKNKLRFLRTGLKSSKRICEYIKNNNEIKRMFNLTDKEITFFYNIAFIIFYLEKINIISSYKSKYGESIDKIINVILNHMNMRYLNE